MDSREPALENPFVQPRPKRRILPWLVLLLVMANLAAFGYLFLLRQTGEDMGAHRPFNADSVRLIPPAPQTAAATGTIKEAGLCLQWGPIASSEREKAQTRLASLNLGDRLVLREELQTTWWVHIPPMPKDEAARKMDALRDLGVKDYSLLETGPDRDAISLGLFSTEQAARKRLAELQAQGVKSAVLDKRGARNAVVAVIASLDERIMKTLLEIKGDFPGSEVKASPCQNK
jgi:hypothetical protein